MQNAQKNAGTVLEQLPVLLDTAHHFFDKEDYFSGFQEVGNKLTQLYNRVSIDDLAPIRAIARNHPVFTLCQQDPYTHRAFTKPRGYAGDAVMLDYVYSGTAPAQTQLHGRGIFECTTRGSMGSSVLYRRTLLTAYINDTVLKNPAARILSVASGHCRELSDSLALSGIFKGEVIAFDQDSESCAEVDLAYQGKVKTLVSSVRTLWGKSAAKWEQFDFIYSAGLYDYLPEAQAIKLSNSLKLMLKPGGRLVIGNFSHQSSGRGYLDLIMDWHLLYRNKQEFSQLLGDLTGFSAQIFDDPYSNVTYAELIKDW